jgi:hypothetical protein
MYRPSAYVVAIVTMALMALLATVLLATAATAQYATPPAPAKPDPPSASASPSASCPNAASRLYLPDGPHANYFYSDCHESVHVIITSPRAGDNLGIVKPRMLVAWPAGNSGALAQFESGSGQAGYVKFGYEVGDLLNLQLTLSVRTVVAASHKTDSVS